MRRELEPLIREVVDDEPGSFEDLVARARILLLDARTRRSRMRRAQMDTSRAAEAWADPDERLRAIVERQMKAGESANAGLLTLSGVSVRELHRLVAVVKKRMPQITTQALVVHSREDDITSRWNADYVERKLGGPVVKILLDDCYHMITVDLQYRLVVELSVDFIQQRFKQQSNTPPAMRQASRQLA
jgi:pimeloyl-ACP methyl ester carboxylesterase